MKIIYTVNRKLSDDGDRFHQQQHITMMHEQQHHRSVQRSVASDLLDVPARISFSIRMTKCDVRQPSPRGVRGRVTARPRVLGFVGSAVLKCFTSPIPVFGAGLICYMLTLNTRETHTIGIAAPAASAPPSRRLKHSAPRSGPRLVAARMSIRYYPRNPTKNVTVIALRCVHCISIFLSMRWQGHARTMRKWHEATNACKSMLNHCVEITGHCATVRLCCSRWPRLFELFHVLRVLRTKPWLSLQHASSVRPNRARRSRAHHGTREGRERRTVDLGLELHKPRLKLQRERGKQP
jgi:hypothetical protein